MAQPTYRTFEGYTREPVRLLRRSADETRDLVQHVADLEAENKRLRDALEKIEGFYLGHCRTEDRKSYWECILEIKRIAREAKSSPQP